MGINGLKDIDLVSSIVFLSFELISFEKLGIQRLDFLFIFGTLYASLLLFGLIFLIFYKLAILSRTVVEL